MYATGPLLTTILLPKVCQERPSKEEQIFAVVLKLLWLKNLLWPRWSVRMECQLLSAFALRMWTEVAWPIEMKVAATW